MVLNYHSFHYTIMLDSKVHMKIKLTMIYLGLYPILFPKT